MRKFALIPTVVLLQLLNCSVPVSGADTAESPEIKVISDRIKVDPKNAHLYFKRAKIQYKYLDFVSCIADSTSSIKLKPTADAYFLRAKALREIGKLNEAELDFEKCTQLEPSSQDAFAELSVLAAKLHHYEKAKKAFDGLFKLNPDRSVERVRRAEMYLQMGKPDDALIDVQTALKKNFDKGGRCHELLGRVYLEKHQYAKAVDALTFAIKKNEFNIDARQARVKAYEGLGKHDLAKQAKRELDEDFSEAFHNAPFRSK